MKRCGPSASRYHLPPVFGYRNHDLRLRRAPAYSFGERTTSNAFQTKSQSPGPAAYSTADKTRFGKSYNHAVDFNTRQHKKLVSESPAPNQYYNHQLTGRRPPAYTFGYRHTEILEMGEC